MTNLITQLPDLISGDIANDTMKPVVVESERTGEHTTTPTTPYYNMELGAGEAITNHKEGLADEFNDEENDELQSIAQSIVSSVLTADGIHDPVGFTIVCFVILIGDMSRGVMFPSMWPLVLELGGTQVTLGYSVASFSFGRILVSPLFGSWSVTYGYTKTLLLSCAILFFGAFLYSQIQNVGRIDFLILCQTILGIGSGTLGVTRAFVAEVTAHRSRTTYMAWTTAVQYAGFAMTPFIGALFNKTLANTDIQLGFFRINMFTAPAYFMMAVVAGVTVIMLLYFKERDRLNVVKDPAKKKSKQRAAIEEHANQRIPLIGLTIYDCCILGCMLLNIATKGSLSSFETLGISIAMSNFDMPSSEAAVIVATCGTVGVCGLLSMGTISTYLTDIQLVCIGLLVMCLGILSLSFMDEDDEDNSPWRFSLAIFMIYSIGYPLGHTAVIGLFSKVVGRRPQGTLLGWFASAGSLARMTFPVMSGYVANYLGVQFLFYILACVLVVSVTCTLIVRKTLAMLSK